MKFHLTGILAGLFITIFCAQSQEQVLSGQIIDRDTRKGIGMATVVIDLTKGTLSDSSGYFSLEAANYPLELTISHLSYGTQSFTLNFHPKEKLVFQLEQLRTNIPEILVSGKKLQILTKGADYSISSFEFDDNFMWQIGMVNNQAKGTRLYLTNLIGDTITSIPIKLPASFLKDILGNVHLETEDSVFQLFGQNSTIQLMYGEKTEVFKQYMGNYQATLGPGLVYFRSSASLGEDYVYYIDALLDQPEQILVTDDLPDDYSWLPSGLQQLGRVMGPRTVRQILDQQRSYYKEIRRGDFFKLKDSLYIFDLNNDKIHTIGPDRQLVRCVPVTFHHNPNPTITNLYLNYDDFITDPLNGDVYVQYHSNNRWRFVPLDPLTGKTDLEIQIPQYNAMDNIRIHGGAIYFTYPEKLFPYFMRIYRQVIE